MSVYLTMCFSHRQTLNPFLCIRAIFCFQYKLLVVGKNFECFWYIPPSFFRNFNASNGADVEVECIVMGGRFTFFLGLQEG